MLTQRELNRALLARQLLLERVQLPIPRVLERMGGLQAQYAQSVTKTGNTEVNAPLWHLGVNRNGKHLAIGSTTGGLWMSDDDGESWRCISAHLPPIYAVRFA